MATAAPGDNKRKTLTHTSCTAKNHREGILAVYHQLLLKQIYTMTKRVLLLNLMNIEGLCEEGGARTHAVTKKSWQPLPAAIQVRPALDIDIVRRVDVAAAFNHISR